jgi:hypothetical protein
VKIGYPWAILFSNKAICSTVAALSTHIGPYRYIAFRNTKRIWPYTIPRILFQTSSWNASGRYCALDSNEFCLGDSNQWAPGPRNALAKWLASSAAGDMFVAALGGCFTSTVQPGRGGEAGSRVPGSNSYSPYSSLLAVEKSCPLGQWPCKWSLVDFKWIFGRIFPVEEVRPPGASMPLRAGDALADYTEDACRWQVL